MKVLIHAMEEMYQGLHGIESSIFIEVKDRKEASMIASDMSREVIEDYTMNTITEIAEEEGYDIDELIDENLCYYIYEVNDKGNSMSIEKLNNLLYTEGVEYMIDNYTKGEIM